MLWNLGTEESLRRVAHGWVLIGRSARLASMHALRRAEVDQGHQPGLTAGERHAYPSHTMSAATSMMTVSANRRRSHEFMPQNGRREGDNPRYLGHGSVAVRSVASRIRVT